MIYTVYSMSEGSSVPFDSELSAPDRRSRPNWTLTIMLRIQLVEINSRSTPPLTFNPRFTSGVPSATVYNARLGHGYVTDAEQSPARVFRVLDWNQTERTHFRRQFERLCNHYWSGRFWLRTPDSYSELDWPPGRHTHRPNVWCEVEFRVVDDPTQAHARFEVVRLDRAFREDFRPYADRRTRSGRLTDLDIMSRAIDDGVHQIAACHEVAHLLGIEHVGLGHSTCRNDSRVAFPNGHDCYGIGGERQYISGVGLLLGRQHAEPWRRRIARHTGVSSSEWQAHLLQHRFGGPDNPRPVGELPVGAYVGSVLDQIRR